MKKLLREIFSGTNNRLSSKRLIGTCIVTIAICMALDAHFSERELNESVFNSMMYTGGALIGVGVAEGLLNKPKPLVE